MAPSRWVWVSMMPGVTRAPEASSTLLALGGQIGANFRDGAPPHPHVSPPGWRARAVHHRFPRGSTNRPYPATVPPHSNVETGRDRLSGLGGGIGLQLGLDAGQALAVGPKLGGEFFCELDF